MNRKPEALRPDRGTASCRDARELGWSSALAGPGTRGRRVRELAGVKIPGGQLDHAGAIALDSARPNAGFVDFVIEVKNVRQTLYPRLPRVRPVLEGRSLHRACADPHAPKIHHTTFLLFKAIGAIAYHVLAHAVGDPSAVRARAARGRARPAAAAHSVTQVARCDGVGGWDFWMGRATLEHAADDRVGGWIAVRDFVAPGALTGLLSELPAQPHDAAA